MKKILLIMIIALGVISCTKQQNNNNIEGIWLGENQTTAFRWENGYIINENNQDTTRTYKVTRKELITYHYPEGDLDYVFVIHVLTDTRMEIYRELDDGTTTDTLKYDKIQDI